MTQTTTDKKRIPFDTSFLIFAAIALIAGSICYARGKEVFLSGLDVSLSLLLIVIPRMVAAFFMAGFVEVLVPKGLVMRWIGEKSGLKGLTIASLAGIFTPGGPIISFPLIAALYELGADIGPLVSFLLSWELLGIQRIVVWEIPFMGMKFALLRVGVSLLLPILAGASARKLALYLGGSFKVKKGD